MLPYLEITKDGIVEGENNLELQVPNIEGKTITEAQNILKENNLKLIVNNEQEGIDRDNNIVKEQTPKAGIKVKENSTIYVNYK